MKFLVDANLGRKFANLLREAGHDTVFANDLRPLSEDEELLAKAEGKFVVVEEGRLRIRKLG